MGFEQWFGAGLILLGMPCFLAGTAGLLRFSDVYCRIHALTKADNLGLGLVVAGLLVQADSWSLACKLVLIWLLVLVASATVSHLVARSAMRSGLNPWSRS